MQDDAASGRAFFARLDKAIGDVSDDYDVAVIDCPPQLGYLTMSALCTATAVLITVHPQMLDVMWMYIPTNDGGRYEPSEKG